MLSTDELAARATLLTIVAALQVEPGETGPWFRVEPAQEPLSYDAAAKVLAMLDKPIVCTAERQSEVVAVRCEKLADPVHVRMHESRQRSAVASLKRLIDLSGTQTSDQANNGPILLRGSHQALLLPLSVIEVWERDYFLAFPRSITGNRADRAAKAQGAVAILSVRASRATSRDVP